MWTGRLSISASGGRRGGGKHVSCVLLPQFRHSWGRLTKSLHDEVMSPALARRRRHGHTASGSQRGCTPGFYHIPPPFRAFTQVTLILSPYFLQSTYHELQFFSLSTCLLSVRLHYNMATQELPSEPPVHMI